MFKWSTFFYMFIFLKQRNLDFYDFNGDQRNDPEQDNPNYGNDYLENQESQPKENLYNEVRSLKRQLRLLKKLVLVDFFTKKEEAIDFFRDLW